jgi:hypothetical protein
MPSEAAQQTLLHNLQTGHLSSFELSTLFLSSITPFLSPDQKVQLYFVIQWFSFHWWILIPIIALLVAGICFQCIHLISWQLSKRTNKAYLELVPHQVLGQTSEATAGLYTVIHSLLGKSGPHRFFGAPVYYSLELIASREVGVRYVLVVPVLHERMVRQALLSYSPSLTVTNIPDPLPRLGYKYYEYRQSNYFSYPFKISAGVEGSDPMNYLISAMTHLEADEAVVVQLLIKRAGLSVAGKATRTRRHFRREAARSVDPRTPSWQTRNPQITTDVEEKLRSPLFAISLKHGVYSLDQDRYQQIRDSLTSAYAGLAYANWQSLRGSLVKTILLNRLRRISLASAIDRYPLRKPSIIVSPKELASLYHLHHAITLPMTDTTTVKSIALPLPVSVKNTTYDVIFGQSLDTQSPQAIGVTDDDRSRHVYMLGQTGSGKSTILYHMAKADMASGQGLAVIDPHGDLIEDLLSAVPERRIADTILFDPSDISYPIGLNLLELDSSLTDPDEILQDKELVCESVISIFRRLFGNEKTDAHRIEYVLRNTIHTAFTVPEATIFTVYELLNNPKYQKKITAKLIDPHLKNFWNFEFGKAGDYQQVKMVSGVTAKIGRFLFSPSIHRMFEQPHSTIDFTSIIDEQKILLCNLSEGKLGEDNSHLLGIAVIAKLHLALLRRAKQDMTARLPFYLFVDEFQHYASDSFTGLLSGGRKFGLRVTLAQQSTAQLEDKRTIEVILANTGTVICFRTASPMDADTILPQFAPYVTQQDLVNLPRHRFYLKLGSKDPEHAFSGITLPIAPAANTERVEAVRTYSREHYARAYIVELPKKIAPHRASKPIAAQVTALSKAGKTGHRLMKDFAPQKN